MASSSYNESRCSCFWEYLPKMTRLWGILTAAVMSGVGVDLMYHGHNIGACVLIGSLLVFFLEIAWAFSLFLNVCLRQDDGQPASPTSASCSAGLHCFRAIVQWCDKPSKKAIFYVFLGAVILLWPQHHLWLSPVAGVMLLLLAALYFLQTLRARGDVRDTLLPGREGSFDRFDDTSDVLDDSLLEPISRRLPTPPPSPQPDSQPTSLQFTRHMPRSVSATLMVHQADVEEAVLPQSDASSGLGMSPKTGETASQRTHALVDGFGDQEIILKM